MFLGVYGGLFILNGELLPFGDNASYVDAAVNYVTGHGFTSTCWYGQGGDTLWAGNVPLYQFFLIPWFEFCGINFNSVLWLNFAYVATGAIFIWLACKNARLIASAPWRLGAVVIFLFSDCAHCILIWGRPEPLSFFLLSLAAFGLTIRRVPFRLASLFAIATLIPWANLPNVVFTAVVGGLLLLFYHKVFWREVVCFALGGAAGILTLLAFYHHYGVLNVFFACVAPHLHGGYVKFAEHSRGGLTQPFLLPFIALVVLYICVIDIFRHRPLKSPFFMISCLVCIPLSFLKIGVFPSYYGWYLLFFMVVLIFAWLSQQPSLGSFSWSVVMTLIIVTAICPGSFPRRSIKNRLLEIRDGYVNPKAKEFVRQVLKPSDIAWVDSFFYYEAKLRVKGLYSGSSLMSTLCAFHHYPKEIDDLNSITVCIWPQQDSNTPSDANPYDKLPNAGQFAPWLPTGDVFHVKGVTYEVYRRASSSH